MDEENKKVILHRKSTHADELNTLYNTNIVLSISYNNQKFHDKIVSSKCRNNFEKAIKYHLDNDSRANDTYEEIIDVNVDAACNYAIYNNFNAKSIEYLKKHEDNPLLNELLAKYYYLIGDYVKEEEQLNNGINKESVYCISGLAIKMLLEQRIDDAERLLTKISKKYELAGRLTKYYDIYIEDYDMRDLTIVSKSGDLEKIVYKVMESFNENNLEKALSYCRKGYKIDPENNFCVVMIALSHFTLRQYEECIEWYKRHMHISNLQTFDFMVYYANSFMKLNDGFYDHIMSVLENLREGNPETQLKLFNDCVDGDDIENAFQYLHELCENGDESYLSKIDYLKCREYVLGRVDSGDEEAIFVFETMSKLRGETEYFRKRMKKSRNKKMK